MRSRIVAAVLATVMVLAAVTVTGCGGGGEEPDAATPAGTGTPAPAAAPPAPVEPTPVDRSPEETNVYEPFPTDPEVTPESVLDLIESKQPMIVYFFDSTQKTTDDEKKGIDGKDGLDQIMSDYRGAIDLVSFDISRYVTTGADGAVLIDPKLAEDESAKQTVELATTLGVKLHAVSGHRRREWLHHRPLPRVGRLQEHRARGAARHQLGARMDSLFDEQAEAARAAVAPLAVRMRPQTLSEFVGQGDVVGPGTWLRQAIEADTLSSLILYGPAGTGKTSLARVIAGETTAYFEEVSAVSSGVAELRKVIDAAGDRLAISGRRTILFVDEIHRFSKSQQDALLHAVEDRLIVLIGATTENPFFEVNAPLISRSRVIVLEPLSDEDISAIVDRALHDGRGYGDTVVVDPDAFEHIVRTAGGDARVALTTLEIGATLAPSDQGGVRRVSLEHVREATRTRQLPYDKTGDVHYDVISAFIKSMRGSDPDAAVYWLARMIEGGEDPKFIARRILILASEDIGNADPQALLIAHAAFKAAESIGWPECRISLSQAAVYMALAPKSNASYVAIDAALAEVKNGPARAVPSHLRDRHRPGAAEYGRYRYPHDFAGAVVEQQYLPDGIERGAFWRASDRGWEAQRWGSKAEPSEQASSADGEDAAADKPPGGGTAER